MWLHLDQKFLNGFNTTARQKTYFVLQVQYIKLVNSSSGISLATKTIPTTTTTNASPQTVNILNKMPILSAISNAGIAKSTNVVLAEVGIE